MKLKLLFLLALLFVLTAAGQAQDPVIRVSTPEQIKAGFVKVPCENRERLTAVRTLFEQAGAPSADITIDHYKTVENLVVIKRGESAEELLSELTTIKLRTDAAQWTIGPGLSSWHTFTIR